MRARSVSPYMYIVLLSPVYRVQRYNFSALEKWRAHTHTLAHIGTHKHILYMSVLFQNDQDGCNLISMAFPLKHIGSGVKFTYQ